MPGTVPAQPDRAAQARVRPVQRAREIVSARTWLVDIGVLVLLAVAYNVVRGYGGDSRPLALLHAHDIIRLEGGIIPHLELPLNRWVAGFPVFAVFACYFYALMHYAATPAVLWLTRKRGGHTYWLGYWSLVLASSFALVGYAFFPVAPPRLVPGLGVIDVMREFAAYGWWGAAASAPRGIGDATNQFAAMPSMHFGWALWCSIQMWGFGGRVWRALAIAYPTMLAVVVLGTGNHFIVDLAAGAACVLVARALVAWVLRWTTPATTD